MTFRHANEVEWQNAKAPAPMSLKPFAAALQSPKQLR